MAESLKRDRKRAIVHGFQLFHNENRRREQNLQKMLEYGIIQEEEDREIAFQDQDQKLRITIHLKLFGFDSESELDADTISDSDCDSEDFEEEFLQPYMFFITGENPLGIVEKHLGSQKRKEAILYARSKVVNVVGVLTSEAEADKMCRRESDVVYYKVLTGSKRLH